MIIRNFLKVIGTVVGDVEDEEIQEVEYEEIAETDESNIEGQVSLL